MDGISGSTDSLISPNKGVGDIRFKGGLFVSTFKHELDAQVQAAKNLIESAQVPYPKADPTQTPQQVDIVA